ncbi:A/G-specific adenine glycosylase [Acinetobacter sp. MD2]|uniref:A/G-specific adenine glycosylase n=1 Tax=Acinetobacter sp. MD2 TaxID=2600066 RepID=UPI002D1EA357|nr:A/G-specific adenine glycosylase [Acinetobacter sp. MD2]MEB3767398.1 A/G-specific adenine glycosylase [Acinetobacter sp. MD2]
MSTFSFSDALLTWFDQYGRHDLPWQVADDPYKVWVSEIMLQQTQVKTVLQYFELFIQRFPTVDALAQVEWDDVAPYWAGLGYYARARNLHKAAKIVAHNKQFPQTLAQWIELPGIGRSTAGALMSLGLRQYGVILDGNVKRVLARFLAIDDDLTKPTHEKKIWEIAEQLCPSERNHDYTQAIMDLGATICTPKKPLCLYCPMQSHCQARLQGLETELPYKKPKKAVPTRTGEVLLLECQEQWLWQQRPSLGLWGGLWSLPIFDDITALQQQLNHLGLNSSVQNCGTIRHSFTHFTWELNIQYVKIAADQMERIPVELTDAWLSVEQVQAKGIPTAMKKVIQHIDVH